MFEADVTDVNGIGAIGGLGLEPAAGAIPLTGTNDPLTGGMSPEVLEVPTLGAENYDTTAWPLDSVANGPPLDEDDGPIEGSPSSVDPLMGLVANGQGEPSISGLMDEAVENVHSSLQEFAAGPDLREKLRGENGGSEATQDATPDWLTGNFGGLPLALNTEQSDVQEQAESQYRTASAEFPQEEVNLRSEWTGGVHDWSIQGEGVDQPSPFNVNDALDDPQKFQAEGVFNLGSNIRDDIDGRNGINNANWGSGSVREGLPDDRFLVKGYTEVDKFDFQPGKYYRFEAKGDDGYQIWVKNIDTEQWDWVTPENQWQTTNDQGDRTDKFLYKVPDTPSEGGYNVGFFYYENGGEANFGLNWAEMDFDTYWYAKAYDISGTPQKLDNYEEPNTRSDGKKGFQSWWDRGAGPHTGVNDYFDMIFYTQANFERGQTYNFNVTADDGYAVGVIPIDENGSAQYVTPWEVNKDAYNPKTYSFTPQNNGKHWVVAYYSEDEGDSSFDLSWESAADNNSSDLVGGQQDSPELIATFLDPVLDAVPSNFLSNAQESVPLILSAAESSGVADPAQIAYIMATAQHESFLSPIEEFSSGQQYERRTDLGNNQTGDGPRFKGRGYVQLTGRNNYTFWSERLGVDLVNNPEKALEPEIAATILVQGMRDGTFTGKKLNDYINGTQIDFFNARRIVNGTDRAADIASIAQNYLNAMSL